MELLVAGGYALVTKVGAPLVAGAFAYRKYRQRYVAVRVHIVPQQSSGLGDETWTALPGAEAPQTWLLYGSSKLEDILDCAAAYSGSSPGSLALRLPSGKLLVPRRDRRGGEVVDARARPMKPDAVVADVSFESKKPRQLVIEHAASLSLRFGGSSESAPPMLLLARLVSAEHSHHQTSDASRDPTASNAGDDSSGGANHPSGAAEHDAVDSGGDDDEDAASASPLVDTVVKLYAQPRLTIRQHLVLASMVLRSKVTSASYVQCNGVPVKGADLDKLALSDVVPGVDTIDFAVTR